MNIKYFRLSYGQGKKLWNILMEPWPRPRFHVHLWRTQFHTLSDMYQTCRCGVRRIKHVRRKSHDSPIDPDWMEK